MKRYHITNEGVMYRIEGDEVVTSEYFSLSQNLENLLKQVGIPRQKNVFNLKFKLLQEINKSIEILVKHEAYENIPKEIIIERDNLYKELR